MSERPQLSVVTPIREGRPLLSDIPGQLRRLAERIENGELQDINDYLFIMGPSEEDYHKPLFLCFGRNPNRHEAAGFLMHAASLTFIDGSVGD